MLFSLLVAAACATSPRPVADIPGIRHEINDTIASDATAVRRTADFQYEPPHAAGDPAPQLPSSRKIAAMGRVTADRAVVYTKPGATRLEETWVREPEGWKLAHVKELDGATSTSASR